MQKNEFKFETFTRDTRRSTVEPMVGIQKRGSLSLNAAAYKVLKGENRVVTKHPRRKQDTDIFVELLYDKVNRVVALRYVTPDNPNSFLVRKQPNSATFLVSAKAFLKHHDIRATKGMKPAKMYGPDVLMFSLEKG